MKAIVGFAIWVGILTAGLSADALFESLYDNKEGKKINAIVLRDVNGNYVLATKSGTKTQPKSRFQRYGMFTPETERLNDLLNSIESWIRRSRFQQAMEKLPMLDQALKEFTDLAQLKIRSSATPEEYRAALKVALDYYQFYRDSVKPTIDTLELSRELKKNASALSRTKAVDPDAYVAFLKSLKELKAVGKSIEIAEPEKKEALALASSKQSDIERRLISTATENFGGNWNVQQAASVFNTLRRASAVDPEVAAIQLKVIEPMVKAAADIRKTLKATVTSSYKFEKEPNVTRDSLTKAETSLRGINSSLSFVAARMFGDDGEKAAALLRECVAANREETKAAQDLYNTYFELVNTYRTVEGLGRRRLYQEAVVKVDEVREIAKGLGVLDLKFNNHLKLKTLEYTGRSLSSSLRDPEETSAAEIEALIKTSEAFYRENFRNASLKMVPFKDMTKNIDELRNYLAFDKTFQKVISPDSKTANWRKLHELHSLWSVVTDPEKQLHSVGKKAYEQFMETGADAIYQAAAEDFKNKSWGISSKEERAVLLRLIKWQQSKDRAGDAADLILIAYDSGAEKHASFLTELTRLDAEGALIISKTDLDKSEAIFSRLRERFPDQSKSNNTQERLLDVLHRQASAAEKSGDKAGAVKILERICKAGPDFASRNRVFHDLFRLLPETDPGFLADNEKCRTLLETYCKDYGYRMQDVSLLKQQAGVTLVEFLTLWDGEKDPEAAADFLVALNQKYPNMIKESKLIEDVFQEVRQRVFKLRQKVGDTSGGTTTVPRGVLTALEKLNIPDFRYYVEKEHLNAAQVELKKAKALEYIALGSFAQAFDMLESVQKDFPELSEQYQVRELMEEKRKDLWLENVCQPLGIRSKLETSWGNLPAMYIDAGALLFWVIYFFVYLLNGFSRGRQIKQLGYLMKHFLLVFATFLILMVMFITVGNMNHLQATALSLVIPTVLFNAMALVNFNFFPLVYTRRYLGLQRVLLGLPVIGSQLTGLREKVERKESDVELLADPWAYRIEQFGRLSDKEQAVAELTKVLEKIDEGKVAKLKDKRPRVLFLLGRSLFEQGKYDDALKTLGEFCELKPDDIATHEMLGTIHFEQEHFSVAINHLKLTLASHGSNDTIMYRLGRCYYEINRFKSAIKCFDAIADVTRDVAFFKARCLARLGEREKSVTCYQELLKSDPDDGRVMYSLASSFAMMSQDVKAFKVINLIKEDNPYYAHAVGLQGSLLLRNSKDDKAEEFFKRALELNPKLVPALHGLGQLKMSEGDLDQATKLFEQVLEIEPFNSAAAFHLAAVREQKGAGNATDLFLKALDDPQLQPLASIHVARLKFKEGAYEDVLKYYSQTGKLELTMRDHYMNCYSAIEMGELDAVRASFVKLNSSAARGSGDPVFAKKALVSLARELMSKKKFKDAIACLTDLKKGGGLDTDQTGAVDRVLSEASFRMAYEFAVNEDFEKAEAINSTLTKLPEEMGFTSRVLYQQAILKLKAKDYQGALSILSGLSADDVRVKYHMAVCHLGLEESEKAAELVADVESTDDLPAHLVAGTAIIRGFRLANSDKITEAEQVLANLAIPPADGVANDYIRSQILLTRSDYLCRIQDSTRLQFLLHDMNEEDRASVAYLQAVAALEGGGQISNVVKNLKPYVDKSRNSQALYSLLTVRLVKQMIEDENFERALSLLNEIKDPSEEIKTVLYHLQMSDALGNLSNLQVVHDAVNLLEEMRSKVKDSSLLSIILHNLFILRLKYPILLDEANDPGNATSAWKSFQEFMDRSIGNNIEFWNSRIARLGTDDDLKHPFVMKEIDNIMFEFKANVLLPTYIGSALSCLQGDHLESLSRHIGNVIALGKAEDKVKEYTQRLGITAKHYSESLAKDDPITKTWGFVIGYLMIQIYVREAVNPGDKSPLRPQLEAYLKVRTHYSSPAEFLKTKKVFNTKVLDALQKGIEGKFTKAGEMLEKCITKVPPGVNLDQQLEAALWTIREQARKPGNAAEQGINMSQEFERVYQRVLNFSVQRGN